MPVLRIPSPLRSYVDGLAEVPVSGTTAGEAVESLLTRYPALRPHLTDSRGGLRPFVHLFLAGTNIRELQGLQTPLGEQDELVLIPSVAGG